MKKTLLHTSFFLLSIAAFAQVPATPNDSIVNDSIAMDTQLEEVVLIGFGTKKAGSITGSVVQIRAADIVRTPAQSAIQAIQGKAAGVNIVTNDQPGANPVIRIRGLGTLIGGRDPLYVIDGVETSGLNGINPNDIATIDILKDASSLAIYGQKGSNGVVLITTKKGKRGEIKVSYDAYYGQKFIQRDVDLANSYRYAYYNNAALGSSSYYNFEQPYNTNWLDEITETGEVISNSVALSGAEENSSYYFGVNNYKEKGILMGSEFERTNILSKNEFRLFDGRLKISPFFNLGISRTTLKPNSAFTNAYRQAPIMPVKYPNGRWGAPLLNPQGLNDYDGVRYNNVANPVAQLFYHNEQNKRVELLGSVNAELKLLDYLKYNSNFGASAEWGRGYTFTPISDINLSQNPTAEVDNIGIYDNSLEQRRNTYYRWNWDNYLTFNKYFGDHNVTVVAGLSRTTKDMADYFRATRYNIPDQSNYWSLDLASFDEPISPGSVIGNNTVTPVVSVAYFARGEYDYKNKYLLTASIRREGVSTFQDSKKFETFPSVSAGWVITGEDFMSGITFLNNFKLRAGYGQVGNATSLALNRTLFSLGGGASYPFGPDQVINPGSDVPFQVDPNLTWETMTEIDLGFDFAAMRNRLTGTFDYYDRKTDDLILPIQIPPVLSPGLVYLNTGVVTNKGFEVTLKWQDKIGEDFTYWVGGNYSHNKNELEEISNPLFTDYVGGGLGNGQTTKQVLEGHPLGSFYVYDVTGFTSDGSFTYSDERVIAGSYIPTYTYGINIGVNYKNVDFSVDAYGVGGNKLYNGKKAQRFGGENVESAVLDNFWTPSTPNATNPSPFNNPPVASTYYIEDGAYLRINNITLGYTLPQVFESIDKVRFYVTAVNPFLFTEYTGYSPEVSGSGDPMAGAGIELDAYPTNKTFLFGLNVGF